MSVLKNMPEIDRIHLSILMGSWLELMKTAKDFNQMWPGMGNKCLEEANEVSKQINEIKNKYSNDH
jgi:hypothetical protein